MKFANKIDAIKALRDLSTSIKPRIFLEENDRGRMEVKVDILPFTLKDSKDFVEACMELASSEEARLRNELYTAQDTIRSLEERLSSISALVKGYPPDEAPW